MQTELLKIPFKDYCEIDAINSSKLKDFFADPKLFYRTYISQSIQPKEEERFFILGRAIHCAVLEPEKFTTEFMVGERRKSTKIGIANHAIAAENGIALISEDEAVLCATIATELPKQNEWVKYHANAINIYSEVVILLTINGVKLKVMLDRCIEHADYVYVDDIKSSSKTNDTDFDDALSEYDYLLQYAFYRFVVEQHFGKPCVFRFVFCSKEEPFNLTFICMDDAQFETGKQVVDYALSKYITAQQSGKWYPEQVRERAALIPSFKMRKYLDYLTK